LKRVEPRKPRSMNRKTLHRASALPRGHPNRSRATRKKMIVVMVMVADTARP
jgi:hypothetical protein